MAYGISSKDKWPQSQLGTPAGLARDIIELAVEHGQKLDEAFVKRATDSVMQRLKPENGSALGTTQLLAQATRIVSAELAAYQARNAKVAKK